MSPRPDLGPKPRLGYAESRIDRAAERRADGAALAAHERDANARAYAIGGELVALRADLPEMLWLYFMAIVLFWVHDPTPDLAATSNVVDRSARLIVRAIAQRGAPAAQPGAGRAGAHAGHGHPAHGVCSARPDPSRDLHAARESRQSQYDRATARLLRRPASRPDLPAPRPRPAERLSAIVSLARGHPRILQFFRGGPRLIGNLATFDDGRLILQIVSGAAASLPDSL